MDMKEGNNHQEISNNLVGINDLSPKNNNNNNYKQQNNYQQGAAAANDRLKRDEWSEGAVSCLLEAYEAKWILRNRAKLKGQDWEDVAKHVSARAGSTKSPKTQTQCKNKIESMKKRYRSESATAADASSWPLYPRLDLLLRGNNASSSIVPPPQPPVAVEPPPPPPQAIVLPAQPAPVPVPIPPPVPPHPSAAALPVGNGGGQNSHGSNGVKEDIMEAKLSDNASDKNAHVHDTNSSSTPALYSDDKMSKSKNVKPRMQEKKKLKKRKREGWEIAESIRLLAEVVVRSEQARMETIREIERMRAEAEAKRGEMDLKRTEIIANTQLEIAKLFASISSKGVDSSLRIGRS